VYTGGRIALVNLGAAEVAEILNEHDHAVSDMAYESDGQLVTRTPDGETITWALGDWAAAFPDSDFTLTGSALRNSGNTERALRVEQPNGDAQVVVADPAAWQERACTVAGRTLTKHEWREYIGTIPYAPACRD
jgi:hypothetical protein